jgi:CO dehydrogenase/acetyl-CoA synthase beta subunit
LKAKVGDYWYLSGRKCETLLELIFSYIGDRICVHYSAILHTPAWYETKVIKYFLNEVEHPVISKLVEQATEIIEENKYTLQSNQIYGAEYW